MTDGPASPVPPPHDAGRVVQAGSPAASAGAVVVLLHGRGSSPEDMLGLARVLDLKRIAWIAPGARHGTWYPAGFMAETAVNAADVASAHALIESVIADVLAAGVPPRRLVLGGFSQGACLALTHAVRFPRAYGAVIGLTGGLIGPPGMTFAFPGSLADVPVLLASGDPDPHVPWARVEETAGALAGMGASVTQRRFPGRAHTVSAEEITLVRDRLVAVVDAAE